MIETESGPITFGKNQLLPRKSDGLTQIKSFLTVSQAVHNIMEGYKNLNTLKIEAIKETHKVILYFKDKNIFMTEANKDKLKKFREVYDELVEALLELDEICYMSPLAREYRRCNISNLIQCDQGIDTVD